MGRECSHVRSEFLTVLTECAQEVTGASLGPSVRAQCSQCMGAGPISGGEATLHSAGGGRPSESRSLIRVIIGLREQILWCL